VQPISEIPQHSFNRCNLPPWVIASAGFQDDPEPLEIDSIRTTDRRLFARLDAIDDPARRGEVFHDYVSVKFRLHEWAEHQASARSSLRSSYVQFLHGWGADSNGHSGAVLKSWVENRFGLPARYHGGRLPDDPVAAERYYRDSMHGAAKTVAVAMQLDLLYTFCQYELQRRHPGERWLTLYRGTHDPEEYAVRDRPSERRALVMLNNVSSFTSDAEVAWEFGSLVWKARIPMQKILFFSGLLPPQLLGGEAEYLVLGGEYRVQTLLY
jgi:NAD+--dinitrogen-reductase ADP-D-ribosyltransferase